jgi:hypothetical protein
MSNSNNNHSGHLGGGSPTSIPAVLIPGFGRSRTPQGTIYSTSSAVDLRNIPMRLSETQHPDPIIQPLQPQMQQQQQQSPPLAPFQQQPQRLLRPPPIHANQDFNSNSYDSLPLAEGQRSPAALSESSHFTSVSQRGVNPAWRPQGRPQPPRGPSREDIILGANPDFQLPASRAARGGRGGRGRGGGVGMGPGRAGSLPGNIGGPRNESPFMDPGGGAYPVLRPAGNTGGGRYPSPI